MKRHASNLLRVYHVHTNEKTQSWSCARTTFRMWFVDLWFSLCVLLTISQVIEFKILRYCVDVYLTWIDQTLCAFRIYGAWIFSIVYRDISNRVDCYVEISELYIIYFVLIWKKQRCRVVIFVDNERICVKSSSSSEEMSATKIKNTSVLLIYFRRGFYMWEVIWSRVGFRYSSDTVFP